VWKIEAHSSGAFAFLTRFSVVNAGGGQDSGSHPDFTPARALANANLSLFKYERQLEIPV